MAWKHNNKPASGMPASGPGWGGAAKGDGRGGAHVPKTETKKRNRGANLPDPSGQINGETAARMRSLVGTPEGMANTAEREARRAENCITMRGVLLDVALNGKVEMARVSAATAYLNREEGMPTQKVGGDDGSPIKIVISGDDDNL